MFEVLHFDLSRRERVHWKTPVKKIAYIYIVLFPLNHYDILMSVAFSISACMLLVGLISYICHTADTGNFDLFDSTRYSF